MRFRSNRTHPRSGRCAGMICVSGLYDVEYCFSLKLLYAVAFRFPLLEQTGHGQSIKKAWDQKHTFVLVFFFLPLEHQTLLKGDSDMFVARSFVEDGSCGFTAEQQQLRSGRPCVTAKSGQNTSKCPQKLLNSGSNVHFYTADLQHVANAHPSNNTLVHVFMRRAGSNKTHSCKMNGVCYVVKKLWLCLAYS